MLTSAAREQLKIKYFTFSDTVSNFFFNNKPKLEKL